MDNTNRRRRPNQHKVTLQLQDSEGPSLFPVYLVLTSNLLVCVIFHG